MHHTTLAVIVLSALMCAPGGVATAQKAGSIPAAGPGAGKGRGAPAQVGDVMVHPRTQAVVETELTPDGRIRLTLRWNGLRFVKTTAPDGTLEMTLGAAEEELAVLVGADAIDVRVGESRATLYPARASEKDYARIRGLLAGVGSLRAFRQLLAQFEAVAADNPVFSGVLIGGSLIAMLDGDVGAPGRIAKLLGSELRSHLKQVRMAMNCYPQYESEVIRAWDDLWECQESVSVFLYSLCQTRWILWVESAWFSFMRCSAFGW